VGNALLLDNNLSGICKGVTKERRLLENKRNKNISVLILSYASGNLVQHAHTSYKGYHPHLDYSIPAVPF